MTHDVRLMVCHNIGLYVYTKTAYRRTDKVNKVNKVNKGSGGGWRKGLAKQKWSSEKSGVARDLCHPHKYATGYNNKYQLNISYACVDLNEKLF